jgi:hypothetical protein
MSSLKIEYLNDLTFTSEQISTLRSLGEYRGKQALFFKQLPADEEGQVLWRVTL